MKTALTIAGSDCSGGAGIQADIKTMSALGVFGMSVITSVVAENTRRVLTSYDVPPAIIAAQLDAIFEDIEVDAVKVGMLPSVECMEAVASKLRQYKPKHIVIDPVMNAKDGSPLMRSDAADAFIKLILPLATLLTPNVPEAERITGKEIVSIDDMKKAAKQICDMGAKSALIKGGHSAGDAEDVLFDGEKFFAFSHKRLQGSPHGTGCTLSSAIASYLAIGYTPDEAVGKAKEYITRAIENMLDIGKGHNPMNHFFEFYGKGEKQ